VAAPQAGFWRRVRRCPSLRLLPGLFVLYPLVELLPPVSPPFTTSISIIVPFGPRGFITHDLPADAQGGA
jgi:hypothetical protein